MDLSQAGPSTQAVHAGEHPDAETGAVSTPIYETSIFAFESGDQAEAAFTGKEPRYRYTRLSNPTTAVFERKLALLEGGEAALAAASGMGAISAVAATLCRAGDHIVATEVIYGTSYVLLQDVMSRFGVEVTFADATDVDALAAALRPTTRFIFIESPINPTLDIVDIEAVARLAGERAVPLVVDNTLATPYNQRPLALGADIVVHSASKYIGGHGDVIAGAVVGSASTVDAARRGALRTLGAALGPFEAWLCIRGLKTLALRMERHNANAMAVARFLRGRPAVERVFYPGLEDHPGNALARRQMRGFGGMVSFEVRGGLKAARRVMNSVRLCTRAVSLGDVDTLIEHPATMSHASIPKKVREPLGVTDGLIRLSVGIEDAEDIIADLDFALAKS